MSLSNHFQAIVVGAGTMGSATCYHLAIRGIRVLGLEQFDAPHEQGSHTGQSRIIRKAYFEHPDYVPLLQRAYENWAELEALTGTQVYFKTGLLYIGRETHALIEGVRESACLYNIELESWSHEAFHQSYPAFRVPSDYTLLLEPDAGFLQPEKAIRLYLDQAIKRGASIHNREKTTGWEERDGHLTVYTDRGHYTCDKLIITAGAWAGKLLPRLAGNLHVTQQDVAWMTPRDETTFQLGNFPCWTLAEDDKPGIYYGFPMLPEAISEGPSGAKAARHYPGPAADPDNANRQPDEAEKTDLMRAMDRFFPGTFAAVNTIKTCLYTNTPDEHFILDVLPDTGGKVVVAAGFSGHGFKFASVVGEIMADLAMYGKTALPIGFLNARRFL